MRPPQVLGNYAALERSSNEIVLCANIDILVCRWAKPFDWAAIKIPKYREIMKWEYKTIRIDGYVYSCSTKDRFFNEMGEEGWELVDALNGVGQYDFIFKRIKEDQL